MKKYDPVMRSVYESIRNLVEIGERPEIIAVIITNRFPTFIRFFDVSKDMQVAIVTSIAQQCWFDKYNHHDYNSKTINEGSDG